MTQNFIACTEIPWIITFISFTCITWIVLVELSRNSWRAPGVRREWAIGFMNFPSATISAPEFPLVYPEVNYLWEDKSICGRKLDSQTVVEANMAVNPNPPPPLSLPLAVWWPCTIPSRTAAWSANLCSHLFLVTVSMFSSCQRRLSGGPCHPRTTTVTGSLTGQWHSPTG